MAEAGNVDLNEEDDQEPPPEPPQPPLPTPPTPQLYLPKSVMRSAERDSDTPLHTACLAGSYDQVLGQVANVHYHSGKCSLPQWQIFTTTVANITTTVVNVHYHSGKCSLPQWHIFTTTVAYISTVAYIHYYNSGTHPLC